MHVLRNTTETCVQKQSANCYTKDSRSVIEMVDTVPLIVCITRGVRASKYDTDGTSTVTSYQSMHFYAHGW